MSSAQLWSRPWALADLKGRHRLAIESGTITLGDNRRGGLWLYVPSAAPVSVNGSENGGEKVAGFDHSSERRALLTLPLPVRRRPGVIVRASGQETVIQWPSLPERPPATLTPQTDNERAAYALFIRAQAVWDRLRDVDSALGDPARLWAELRRRWTSDEHFEPQMDIIVRHAIVLTQTLDELDRAPRRILRRTHKQLPISRVQELDRRSMTWLTRQAGVTLAERAGDRQRILAVAREENFDTLENRVLRSYAELAQHIAIAYLDRNDAKRASVRARIVDDYRRRCKRLGRDLAKRGVRVAEPGVMPNFVLQQNPRYHQVWEAWHELLDRDRVYDDLWRWQGRSWEEFCALAVMVSLVSVPGARLIASAPLNFMGEQNRGSWVVHDNPLGVFYLERQRLVLEVRYRMKEPGAYRADFAAPIWITIGHINEIKRSLTSVAVWPVWDVRGGIVEQEPGELKDVLQLGLKAGIRAGVVIRPAIDNRSADSERASSVLALTLGTQGRALWESLERLSSFLSSLTFAEAQR